MTYMLNSKTIQIKKMLPLILLTVSGIIVLLYLFPFPIQIDIWLLSASCIYIWYRLFRLRSVHTLLEPVAATVVLCVATVSAIFYRLFAPLHNTASEFIQQLSFIELAICAAFAGYVAAYISTHSPTPTARITKPRRWLAVVGVVVLLAIGSIQVWTGAASRPLQNDEFLQYEAAHGYVQTGAFVLWDYIHDTPQYTESGEPESYTRGRLHTWLIAQSFSLFGESELSGRLPAMLWYLAFILLIYALYIRWQKNSGHAFVVVLAIVLMDHIIFHGRLVRMYSALLCMTVLTAYAWFATYRYSMREWFTTAKTTVILLLSGAVSMLLSIITIEGVHRLFAAFFPAFLFFICVEAVVAATQKKNELLRKIVVWIGAGVAGIIGVLVVNIFVPFLQRVSFGFRSEANMQYEILPFFDFPLPLLVMMLYLFGLVLAYKKGSSYRFVAAISFALVITFTYFVLRYNAIRYALFIIPFVVPIAFIPLLELGKRLQTGAQRILLSLLLIVSTISFVIPGVSGTVPFFTQSRADNTIEAGYGHDFETAYAYIQTHVQKGEPIFVQELRDVYWGYDPERVFIDLGEDESMKKQELIDIMATYESGWFVWSEGKAHHLRPVVREFIEAVSTDYSNIPELDNTQMVVYHFTKESLSDYIAAQEYNMQ